MMNRIIERVQEDDHYWEGLDSQRQPPEDTTPDAITAAVRLAADTINARRS